MNRVVLIGRLTKDPELRQSQGGKSICSFTLAVDRRKTEGQPDADFIRCKAFGKTAESLCRYMGKGSQIAISGSIQTGSYTNQQGQRVYTTDVMVQEITFLEPKKSSEPPYGDQPNNYSYSPNPSAQSAGNGYYDGEYGYNADDMPF